MKKIFCIVLFICLCTSIVFAAPDEYSVKATLSPDVSIKIDGVTQTLYNAQGQELHPIIYAGTTYIPIRSIGEFMGKNVDWNSSTNTATISGKRTTPATVGKPSQNVKKQTINMWMEPSFTIVIDDSPRTFYDANGKKCDPAVYQGSIYLPIRAIGEIMGKDVDWDAKAQLISLNAPSNSIVTDYDTASGNGNKLNNTNKEVKSNQEITKDAAKDLVLKKVPGATLNNFKSFKTDYDDGRKEYEGKLIYNDMEYEFTIDVLTGNFTEWEVESIYD